MTVKYEAANSSNWESLWSGSYAAPNAPGNAPGLEAYYPIPEITIPLSLDSELIAFSAGSSTAKDNWHFAGQVYQKINTGLTVGGNYDAVTSVRRLYLRQITLIRYPLEYGSTYSLLVKIPYWIRTIDLALWHYTGPVTGE